MGRYMGLTICRAEHGGYLVSEDRGEGGQPILYAGEFEKCLGFVRTSFEALEAAITEEVDPEGPDGSL